VLLLHHLGALGAHAHVEAGHDDDITLALHAHHALCLIQLPCTATCCWRRRRWCCRRSRLRLRVRLLRVGMWGWRRVLRAAGERGAGHAPEAGDGMRHLRLGCVGCEPGRVARLQPWPLLLLLLSQQGCERRRREHRRRCGREMLRTHRHAWLPARTCRCRRSRRRRVVACEERREHAACWGHSSRHRSGACPHA